MCLGSLLFIQLKEHFQLGNISLQTQTHVKSPTKS